MATTVDTRYGTQFQRKLAGKDAFVHTKHKRQPYGYLFVWTFASGTELVADLEVPDPENPPKTMKVVAVFNQDQLWEGGRCDTVSVEGLISSANRALLNTCINSEEGGPDSDITLHYVDYDPKGREYFPSFHSDKEVRKVVITKNTKIYVAPFPCEEPSEPEVYAFTASFTAKGDAGPQKFFCAENIGLKTVKPFGGIGK